MLADLRFALRRLLRSPGFTATALATLALCLGANLAIYAVVDAILLRSLPISDPGRLVTIYNSYPGAGVNRASASLPNYFDRREAIKAFTAVAINHDGSTIVGGAGTPNRVPMSRVSPRFFATLGVPLAMGREFTDDELPFGADEVAILTDGFWRSHFAADPDVIGKTFLNDGITIRVIGVLPRGFHYLSSDAQFYRPSSYGPGDRSPKNRHSNDWQMVARLAPGVTIPQAQAQVDAFNVQQSKDDPYAQLIKGSGYHTVVASLREDHVKEVKPTLVLLQFGGLFLLLIGGVNLANLLLIRASGRTKELAVRQALGAGGFRLARDVLAETTMLSVAGGLLGVLLGGFGVRLFAVLGTSQLPLGASVSLNGRVIAVSLAAAVMAGILLAGPVVWFNGRTKLAQGLQSEGRSGTSGRAAQRLRHAFIIAQVALAFVLLAGAGLLGLSLKRVLETPPGFRPDNILTGEIALPWKNYRDDASRLAFVERLLPALRAVPGVTLAAINSGLPFSGGTNDSAVRVENYTLRPGESVRAHYLEAASPDYWRLMGIPLLRGRLLEDADNHRKALVCVVDEAFAEHYWPGSNPIGHRIANGPFFNPDNATTIVGEVASVKQNDLRENAGHGAVYFPFAELNSGYFHILVRTPLPPSALAAAIQKAVLALDPELPVDRIRPMQALIDNSLVARRSPAILAGIFAGIALLLAAIGTYGVLAYAVAQRRREIGVRMALGALPRQVLVQFLCSGGALLGAGIALGIAGAWAASSAMRTMLYGIGGLPVAVLAATAAAMALVVFSAITIPARRAARVDPIAALHED